MYKLILKDSEGDAELKFENYNKALSAKIAFENYQKYHYIKIEEN